MIRFGEYKERYAFTAKLRLLLFAGFAAFYVYFFRHVLWQIRTTSLIIVALFLLGLFTNWNINRGRFVRSLLIVEIFVDLAMICVIIYLTGGPYSAYFTIYLFYSLFGGVFYNHYLTAMLGLCSALVYGLFLLLCSWGVIPPLILNYGENIPTPGYTPVAHYSFLLIFTILAVFGIKIASQFSQRREKTLEIRNKELTALNLMSSTVRSAVALKKVALQVLAGIKEGLGFETAIIVNFDYDDKKIRFFSMQNHPKLSEIELLLGKNLDEIVLPFEMATSPLFNQLLEKKILFRKGLDELAIGLDSYIPRDDLKKIQQILGVKRVVAVPLVAGERVIGGIIGLCREEFVDQQIVNVMESFANHAALSLEAAILIERLRRINDELQKANRVKSEFLATMSHELRTPLTAIIGYTELLIEGMMGELTAEQSQSLRDVLHNAEDLLELINNLLDLTRIDSGKMPLDKRPFDLEEMLERLHRRLKPLLQNKNQAFDVSIADGFVPVYADERKIQQVILNLLSNANKFTQDEGKITVLAKYFPDVKSAPWFERAPMKIKASPDGAVEICVADNGIGIAKEELENIFHMFHQIESGVTRSFSGTGLGLALARKMVELHDGMIWAESTEGKGSEFYVVIPYSKSV